MRAPSLDRLGPGVDLVVLLVVGAMFGAVLTAMLMTAVASGACP